MLLLLLARFWVVRPALLLLVVLSDHACSSVCVCSRASHPHSGILIGPAIQRALVTAKGTPGVIEETGG